MKIRHILFIILFLYSHVAFSQLSEIQQKNLTENKKQLEKYKSQNNKSQTVHYLKKIGKIYWDANQTNEAITNYSEAREIIEQTTNYSAILEINNYLGTLYSDIGKNSEAEKCYQKCLDAAYSTRNSLTIVSALMNIGKIYLEQNKHQPAIEKYKEASNIWLELKEFDMLKKAYSKIANCYTAIGDTENSEFYYNRVEYFNNLARDKEIEEKNKQIFQQKQIAKAKAYKIELQKFQLKIVEDSLDYSKEVNEKDKMKIDLLTKTKQLDEAKIKEQKAEAQKKDALLKSKRTLIYSLFGILIVIALTSLIILKLFFDKKKINKKLDKKNKQINEQNIDLEEKNKQINEQNIDLEKKNKHITEQRNDLEKKNTYITDSINYASRIQKAILPSKENILKSFSQAFIFYEPRDIVSGDFYWFAKHDETKFVAAVDCTGHSVPGAFMSMIGNTLLNEIINEKHIYNPKEILYELDKGITTTLKQEVDEQESDNISTDGMDMTLCKFDYKKEEVIIAAANHEVIAYINDEQLRISGELSSIGGHLKQEQDVFFKNNKFPLIPNSVFYLFSDGYPDQFGGKKGKKFMKKRFTDLLEEIHELPMKKQELKISKRYIEWKKNRKQVDDILVIGIRI